MSDLTLVLLAAGSSSRFESNVKKQWLRIDHKPLWQYVADRLHATGLFSKIIITASKDDVEFMKNYASYTFVEGGNTRQQSLKNALNSVSSEHVLVSDIARSCISEEFLSKIISNIGSADCIVPYLKVTDTVVYEGETLDREKVKRIQTPQLSLTSVLKAALETEIEFTDESSAIVANGGSREFILGEDDAHKITFISDLNKVPCLERCSSDILSGNGFDVHAFEDGGEMWLGGVLIDSPLSF